MTLQMVDRHQRQAAAHGHALGIAEPDHHPADQTGPGRRRHPVEGGPVAAGLDKGAFDHAVDGLDMAARRDFRHHPAIGCMVVDLAVDHRGQHLDRAVR